MVQMVLKGLTGELELLNFTGAGCRNRTNDLLITNQLLYQLSYTGEIARFSKNTSPSKKGLQR